MNTGIKWIQAGNKFGDFVITWFVVSKKKLQYVSVHENINSKAIHKSDISVNKETNFKKTQPWVKTHTHTSKC